MIIDARRSNRRFAAPFGVELCSSEGLSRLEVEIREEDLDPQGRPYADVLERLTATLGCTDVKDAFHRLLMPEELMWFFCLGEASGEELALEAGTQNEVMFGPRSQWGSRGHCISAKRS